jgi:type I restriction enzyme M protein
MITIKNLKEVLENLGFTSNGEIYTKKFKSFDCLLKVDFKKKVISYPENKGLKIHNKKVLGFSKPEYFVQLECVNRLLEQGYNPAHIELEPKWKVGHGASGGDADVMVRDNKGKALLLIECKNAGTEFTKYWNETLENGSQLFGYAQQERDASFLCFYASDFIDNKVKPNYHLITLEDNEQYLADNPKFESFKNAKVREDLYRAWKNTYQLYSTKKGLFEKDIQAYNIGKKKYSIDDLSLVDSATKQSKQHTFATILRKYNVSGRENAFDKLVNLFLCKIVDEKNNPKDLQFYWKGIAYDTPFELQDRLQKLYQTGMNEFLKEDVTYIDNQQIDKAFWAFKNDPDATRETIKNYFRQLKFFTNNDFAFIDVHNERLFYENAEVLIDIVQLFQDTKITSSSKNQFLGDMFENFLDGGVKQSEGQFFTPMQITKFIIQSLPLEDVIKNSKHIPKSIDYACGSGHFLNELASQMRPFIEANKQVNVEEYHKAIHGIEKEYRLSKVAKVSAFMYGQDNIDITYADALAQNDRFKSNDYDILVANPPYSVKGFLGTLEKEIRESFELIETVDSKQISTNNSIECFFIEKAKQMLASNGIASIVVPPSILSNSDSTYVATRNIIIKYFDIISLAELPKGTFSQAKGIAPILLFIRRKNNKPEQATHFENRVDSWFSDDSKKQKIFDDEHYIEDYCQHIDVDFEDYKSFLKGNPTSTLLNAEIFTEYKDAFDKLTVTKIKKEQTSFKKLSKVKKEEALKKLFMSFLFKIEKEKIFYFVLANQNPTDVLILKAPSDTKANKKFLGYNWSERKGSQGIKLIKDKDGNHITPLYDPKDGNNPDKISFFIRQNFKGIEESIPEHLTEFLGFHKLVDLIDFNRTDFDKQISITVKKRIEIKTKWKTIKLSEQCEIITKGTTPTTLGYEFQDKGINFVKIESITSSGAFIESKFVFIDKVCNDAMKRSQLAENDILFSIAGALGRTAVVNKNILPANTNQALAIIRLKKTSILSLKYTYELLTSAFIQNQISNLQVGVAQQNLSLTQIKDFKIPLPSDDIQQKIIDQCVSLDKEKQDAEKKINNAINTIEKKSKDALKLANKTFKLSNSNDFDAFIGRRLLKNDVDKPGATIPIFSANVFEPFGKIDKLFIDDFSKPSILWGIDGDWMVNYVPAKYQFYPTDHCGVIRVKTKEVNPRYLTWALNEAGKEKQFSRSHRASTDRIKGISIRVPDIKIQNELEKETIKQEKIIDKANKIIETIAEKKQAIMDKYL